jgi:hypothetical protein
LRAFLPRPRRRAPCGLRALEAASAKHWSSAPRVRGGRTGPALLLLLLPKAAAALLLPALLLLL